MNVTFVALNYAPSVGGAQAHVREVAEGLAGRGHQVTILTTDSLGTPGGSNRARVPVRREVLGGVQVERFGSDGPLGRLQGLVRRARTRLIRRRGGDPMDPPLPPALLGPVSVTFARAVQRAHHTSDVVVACSAPFLTLVATPYLRARGRAATVAMPLLHLGRDQPHRWVAAALRRCDGVTASTTYERDHQVGLGVASDRIALLPPGVHPDAFVERSAPEARAALGLVDRPTVGYVGRLAAYKGVDTLLEAADQRWRAGDDLGVLIAGSPAGWDGFEPALAAVRAIGGDRLVVRERFEEDQKALLLAACDVVAFPSREESFGMVTLEAWAARRPVVAADIDAVRDVIRHGHDGWLVPPGDAPALADAIASLIADPERGRALGEAGRARVEADLSWSTIVDGWEQFLAGAVAHRGGSTLVAEAA